jgi:hypothetical protein
MWSLSGEGGGECEWLFGDVVIDGIRVSAFLDGVRSIAFKRRVMVFSHDWPFHGELSQALDYLCYLAEVHE